MSAWGAFALVVGLAVLSPHPQLLQYMLLTAGAYALFATMARSAIATGELPNARAAIDPRERWKRLALALAAVIIGGAMGAIQYLPVSEYVPWSPRAGGKGYEYATSYSFPIEETINTYLPQFSGILDNYWGRNGIHYHSEYLGALVLMLAPLALGGGLTNRHRRHAWFWLATLVVTLFWAWGGFTPFYHLVYALVPGAKYFRAPSTIMYVMAFSTAVLAAFGTERLLAGRVSMRYAIGWAAGAIVIALMATAGGFTRIAMSLMGDVRGDAIMANVPNVTFGAWRSAFFVLVGAAIVFGIVRGAIKTSVAGWAILVLVAVDLWSVERHYWLFSERASKIFASDPVIDYLQKQAEPGRVIALRLSDNVAFHDPFIQGDALMHHRIRGVLGYHGNELGRFQALAGIDQGYQSVANPNFWALTNARYVYTNVAELPFQGSKLVAGPARNAAGTMTYLFRLPGEEPPAWVVPLIVKADDAATLSTVLNPLFDVKRAAIFDSSANVVAKPTNSPLPEALSLPVSITRYDPGAIDLTVEGTVPAGAALVVSENFYPGWTATVDGKPANIGRADYTLIGVELPAGGQKVSLRFSSQPYTTGKAITLAAVALAVVAMLGGLLLDRRNRTELA